MILSGDVMVIYADVLIFSNIIIDYLLLLLTAKLFKINYNKTRTIISSIFGGLSSLYILIDSNSAVLDLFVKLSAGMIIILIAFGKRKAFITYIVFLLFSFSLNGLVLFLRNFNSNTFISNNLVCYFNISPVILIVLSMVFYLLVRLVQKLLQMKVVADLVEIEIHLSKNISKCYALIDSGHTLIDPFSDSQIIFVDSNLYSSLIDGIELSVRTRLIPVKTVLESSMLHGIRCDYAKIIYKKTETLLKKPIVIESSQPLKDNYNAIISASALNENIDIRWFYENF